MNCNICWDTGWLMMINTWNSNVFAARCTCRPYKHCKSYIEFINFNYQKYMILEEYEEMYRQGTLPIKDGGLAEIMLKILIKSEQKNKN